MEEKNVSQEAQEAQDKPKTEEIQKEEKKGVPKEAKTYNVIDEANKAAAAIRSANAETARLQREHQLLIAQERLGGRDKPQNFPETEKENDVDYAKKVFKGEVNPFKKDETQ